MDFPRFKNFDFTFGGSFLIPSNLNGRADLISVAIYGNVEFYKPLCEANDIVLPYGLRAGIRPLEESIRTELTLESEANKKLGFVGLTQTEIEDVTTFRLNNRLEGELDWSGYNNLASGYISDLYTDRILLTPTSDSCLAWLSRFGKISP